MAIFYAAGKWAVIRQRALDLDFSSSCRVPAKRGKCETNPRRHITFC